MGNFNGIEAEQIPNSFNILRLLMQAEGDEDIRIGIYDIDAYNTNFVNPLFCICHEGDSEMSDIAGLLEESLHAILDHGGDSKTVQEIMGLVRPELLDGFDQYSGLNPNFQGTEIDLGYYLPEGSINRFMVAPADFAPLEDIFIEKQYALAETASYHNLSIGATATVIAHDFTDWQAEKIAQAYKSDINPAIIDLIADPKYNHAKMRELFKLAKDLGGKMDSDMFKRGILNHMPAIQLAEWMREVRLLITQHEGGIALPWQELSFRQIATVRSALDCDLSMDEVGLFAKPEYGESNMALIGRAMLGGMDMPYLNYMLNPAFTPEQLAEVMEILTPTALSPVPTDAQLDYLIKPEYSADRMEVLRNAFTVAGLDIAAVERFNTGEFTPAQMAVLYSCLIEPDKFSDAQIALIADSSLPHKEMLNLKYEFLAENHSVKNVPEKSDKPLESNSKAASLGEETKDTRDSAKALEDTSHKLEDPVTSLDRAAAEARSASHDIS